MRLTGTKGVRSAASKAALALCFLAAGAAASFAGAGAASLQFLKLDASPRAYGMGGAFVAVADDIYAVNYNPAGLGQLYIPEVSAMYQSGFEGASIQNLALGMQLPVRGMAGLEQPAIGASVMYTGSGDFQYRRINNDGSITSSNMDAETNLALGLSYGEKVYSGETRLEGLDLKLEQYLGGTVRYIRSELLETYSASVFAFDAGWLLMEPNLGLSFGAAACNLGGGVKYLNEKSPMPSTLRLGASWQQSTVMDQSFLLSVEHDIYTAEKLNSLRLGLEYRFERIFKGRVGYRALEENGGFTMGLGVHHEGLALDVGMSFGNSVYNSSQIAFTYKFFGYRVKEYKRTVNFRESEPEAAPRKPAAGTRPAARPKPAEKPKEKPKKDGDFFLLY